MKYKILQGLKPEELTEKEQETRFELLKPYGQASTGTAPKNPAQIKNLRRRIARIKTLRATQKQ